MILNSEVHRELTWKSSPTMSYHRRKGKHYTPQELASEEEKLMLCIRPLGQKTACWSNRYPLCRTRTCDQIQTGVWMSPRDDGNVGRQYPALAYLQPMFPRLRRVRYRAEQDLQHCELYHLPWTKRTHADSSNDSWRYVWKVPKRVTFQGRHQIICAQNKNDQINRWKLQRCWDSDREYMTASKIMVYRLTVCQYYTVRRIVSQNDTIQQDPKLPWGIIM